MKKYISIFLVAIIAAGCTALRDFADTRRPILNYNSMSIQSIDFNRAVLEFHFDVNNPNPVGLTADRYSYEFFINDNSFVSGTQDQNLRISRESVSTFSVPVTLSFSEIVNTFSSLIGSDSFAYRINTEVQFDIPGMGVQRLPVNASGELPIPRMPRVEFGGFDVKNLSLAGAEMEVAFRVSNPNRFGISMSNAAYNLHVNGREWLDTRLSDTIRLGASESDTIRIPIRLNASQMGSVLMELMTGRTEFDYNLSGSANIGADIDGFTGGQNLPFDLSGRYSKD
jgi:LEA14-like dessication related protein